MAGDVGIARRIGRHAVTTIHQTAAEAAHPEETALFGHFRDEEIHPAESGAFQIAKGAVIRRFAGKEGISFAVEGHRTRLVIFRSATSGHPFKGRRGGLK